MTEKKIKNLRKAIEHILKNIPETRNSDQYLTLCIWKNFCPDVVKNFDGVDYIAMKDFMELPREDNIKRLRAKIQNEEHKYLPTSWEVAKQRQIDESVWRNYVNYN